MVWPLAHHDALEFVREKREILVIEEKRGIIESQFKEYFYDYPGHKPEHMAGKSDENNEPLVPWVGELSPRLLAPIVAKRLDLIFPGLDLTARAEATAASESRDHRHFRCDPHSVFLFRLSAQHIDESPAKARRRWPASAAISWRAGWTAIRRSLIQMGGEGVNWVASSRFTGGKHVFQNLGEGTYYHSGSMAIRQAVAAKANITYKILFNDAVAMTGGQPVDGPISVHAIAHEVRANGVARIAIGFRRARKFARKRFSRRRDDPSPHAARRRAARIATDRRRLRPDL